MYGMVHTAVRAMALDLLGEEAWLSVLERSGLTDEHFFSSEVYDDAVTMDLVATLSQVSGMDSAPLLEAFGEFWIAFAFQSSYGPMFDVAGETLDELLENLDAMHASIQSTMPGARMPSFELIDCQAQRIDVLYRSERVGLEPFVKGLLQGLMRHFGETGTVASCPDATGTRFTIHKAAESAVA